jgi:hypothetical protein
MTFSSIGPNLSVLGKSLRRTAIVAQNESAKWECRSAP